MSLDFVSFLTYGEKAYIKFRTFHNEIEDEKTRRRMTKYLRDYDGAALLYDGSDNRFEFRKAALAAGPEDPGFDLRKVFPKFWRKKILPCLWEPTSEWKALVKDLFFALKKLRPGEVSMLHRRFIDIDSGAYIPSESGGW